MAVMLSFLPECDLQIAPHHRIGDRQPGPTEAKSAYQYMTKGDAGRVVG